jgi:hypothetical protein
LNPQGKSGSYDVAAIPKAFGISLRVFSGFNALQTQAEACGYQNKTFARAFEGIY